MEEKSGTPRPGSADHALSGMFAWLRGLGVHRDTDNRWLAGVCSGVANRLGIDPLVVRGALIVLLFLGGIGGLAYLLAWALLPDQNGRILAEEALRGDGRGIALLVVIGIVLVSNLFDRWWLWTVMLPIGLVLWWAIRSARAGKTPEEMGEEARRFAARLGDAVGRPAPAQSPPTPGPSAASYPAWGESGVPAPPQEPGQYAHSAQPAGPSVAGPAPYGMGPGRTGAVAAAPRVVHTPRPRGGLLALLLTAGFGMAGYGIGRALADRNAWAGSHQLLAVAFALAGAGLALALVGLTGRRAGFSVFLVTCLAVAAVAGTAVPPLPQGGFGDRTWSAASQPKEGFTLTAGDATLSLSDATPGSTIRVSIGAGNLRILVPKGTAVTVVPNVRVGEIDVKAADGTTRRVSSGVTKGERAPVRAGSGATPVSVEASVGAGQITIVEESA